MNLRILVLVLSSSTFALGLAQCSSGNNTCGGCPADASNDTSSNPDTSTKDGSSNDSSTKDGSSNDGSSSGPQLTVKNYFSWCSVSVNNGTASSSSVQTVSVTPGTIPLSATALSGFILGDWHHTTGDVDGGGDPGTIDDAGASSATVIVGDGGACVWVCCPFTNGTGCPTTDQCP